MALTSLQVCMDESDWLQGTMNTDECGGIDSSSSPTSGGGGGGGGGDHHHMLTCSRPAAHMMERRLRPPHDQALKCPRCDSAHTKFCYYNNYSLSQPRYFCKTCRRYWTKGGTLRNIPVGGGCRKNKKSSSSKKASSNNSIDSNNACVLNQQQQQANLMMGSSSSASSHGATDLQLAFPEANHHFSPLISSLIGSHGVTNFLETKYNALLENLQFGVNNNNHHNMSSCSRSTSFDFMDQNSFMGRHGFHHIAHPAAAATDDHGHDHPNHHHRLMGSFGLAAGVDFGILGSHGMAGDMVGVNHHQQRQLHPTSTNYNNNNNTICSPQQFGYEHGNTNTNTLNMMMDNNRLMLAYDVDDHHHHHHHQNSAAAATAAPVMDVKPSPNKLLTLDWQDDHHQETTSSVVLPGGGVNGLLTSSPWTNMMNANYGPSPATNQLM